MSTDVKQQLEVIEPGGPVAQSDTPILNFPSAKQIKEYQKFLVNYDKFVSEMLINGVDYGVIPGVEKPTLLKPGAEKLEKLMFLRHEKIQTVKEIAEDYSFIKYSYKTLVYNKQNQLVATCEGSCNSHEKKYRYSTVFDNQATPEQKEAGKLETRKSRAGKDYRVYIVEKKDFADIENTIMKMAQKRSYVGAILEATNSSGRFTQDVEDMDLGNGRGGTAAYPGIKEPAPKDWSWNLKPAPHDDAATDINDIVPGKAPVNSKPVENEEVKKVDLPALRPVSKMISTIEILTETRDVDGLNQIREEFSKNTARYSGEERERIRSALVHAKEKLTALQNSDKE